MVNLFHALRVLCGVGIPKGNGRKFRGVTAVHFLPTLIRDLVLVGIGGRDRSRCAWSLTGCVVGLHVVDIQVLEALLLRCGKGKFGADVVSEIAVVSGFVDDDRTALLVAVEDIIGVPSDDGATFVVGTSVGER